MSSTGMVLSVIVGLGSAGALVIALSGRHRSPPESGALWRIYGSTLLIAAAVLVPAALHPALFSLVVAGAAWRCVYELALLHGGSGFGPGRASTTAVAAAVGALALAVWGALSPSPAATLPVMAGSGLLLAVALPVYRRSLRRPPAGTERAVFALTFPLLAAVHLAHLVHLPDGFLWVFLLYATVEAQDSMAFLFGRLFGRRKLLPRLSPGKTVTGAVAGWLSGLTVGTTIAYGLLDQALAPALALGAVVTAAGFAGDLFTSALKRAAGAKDFQAIHPLHGGLLDIYDSTLFAALPLSATAWLLSPVG